MSKSPTSGNAAQDAARTSTPNPLEAAVEQMSQAWTASLDMWSAMANSWQAMLKNRGVPVAEALVAQAANPGAWSEGIAPFVQELQEIFALPRFSDVPAIDHDVIPSVVPAMELMSVAQQFLLAGAQVWARACQLFEAEVAELRRRDAPEAESAGDVMDIWNNVLDQTLMEFNRSSEFAKLQQRFLHAAMGQQHEVRKLGERMAKSVDLPTRSEMDDVYRRLHTLLREVHGLRRELRSLRQGGASRSIEPRDDGEGTTQ